MIISGFGTQLGSFQSLALYLYCSLLLLYFQAYISIISITRTAWWLVYVFMTSAFVVLYAAEVLYNSSTNNFTRSPYTYIIINILLVIVFFVGAVSRRTATVSDSLDAAKTKQETPIVKEASSVDAGSGKQSTGGGKVMALTLRRTPTSFSTTLAARAAGLAIPLYISAYFLDTMYGSVPFLVQTEHLGARMICLCPCFFGPYPLVSIQLALWESSRRTMSRYSLERAVLHEQEPRDDSRDRGGSHSQ